MRTVAPHHFCTAVPCVSKRAHTLLESASTGLLSSRRSLAKHRVAVRPVALAARHHSRVAAGERPYTIPAELGEQYVRATLLSCVTRTTLISSVLVWQGHVSSSSKEHCGFVHETFRAPHLQSSGNDAAATPLGSKRHFSHREHCAHSRAAGLSVFVHSDGFTEVGGAVLRLLSKVESVACGK